jgi:hypothetical protein
MLPTFAPSVVIDVRSTCFASFRYFFKFIPPVRHRFRPSTHLHCDTPGIIFKNLLILTFGAVMSRSSEPLGTLPPLRGRLPEPSGMITVSPLSTA